MILASDLAMQGTAVAVVSSAVLMLAILFGGLTAMHLAFRSRFVLACTLYLVVACLSGWLGSQQVRGQRG